jgi:hypothetical protein
MDQLAQETPVVETDENDQAKLGSEDVIADAKGYLQMCITADANRDEKLDDLRFLSGDQWPDQVKRQRDVDQRPCLTINKLPTFLHQVTNDQRMNVPSIKVSPVNAGNEETAQVVQGLIRHIEYASNSDVCYDTAVNSAAAIGEGFFRLVTDYCTPTSFDQEIKFKRIRNSFTVYFDPMSQEPDGSDQRRCMLSFRMQMSDFTKQYPQAQVPTAGFQAGAGDPNVKDWFGADFIRIAEFYRIEESAAVLVELTNGETGYEDELVEMPPGVSIKRKRATTRPKVMWYKLTALEVLEQTEIKCRWIPVFPVYGDEIDLDGKVIRSGIIRNAKDPAQMYNFWMTAATEEVALRPKTPYVGAEGQFEGYEDDWNQANVKSFSYLEYKPVDLNGQLAPPPQRQPAADIPNGLLTMAMHANDNIKATTGLFDSSLGALGNARSGIQERSQQRQGDVANFHFSDNLHRTVRHVGRCIVNMIPHYYDAPRVIRIMGEDDKISSVPINQPDPNAQQQPPQPGQPPQGALPPNLQGKISDLAPAVDKVLHDLTIGDYDIVVKAGPSYSTLREEAADSMIEFGKSWPKLMDVAGDKVIRTMDWPGADEIADRVAKTIPPELRDDEGGEQQQDPNVIQTPQGPIPADQVPQMLEHMNQQIQQMGQQLQEAQSGVQKAQVDAKAKVDQSQIDAAARVKVAEINAVSASDVAELNGLIKLLVEKMQPPPQLAAAALVDSATQQNPQPVGPQP